MTVAEQVGSCNTPLTVKSDRPPKVDETGIDTWRLTRYLSDDELLAARRSCPNAVADLRVRGHRWGLLTGPRMLWIEGHPAVEGLCAPPDLQRAETDVLNELQERGVPIGTDGGVGRMDFTSTVRFDDPRHGQAVLRAMSLVDVPRRKPVVYGRPPETIYLMAPSGKRMLERVYCKGTEAANKGRLKEIAPYGQRVRFEAQVRFDRSARIRAEMFAQAPVIPRSFFERRFAPVALSTDGLTAATAEVLADRVVDLVGEGKCSASAAERLTGYLQVGPRIPLSESTHRRRRRELRELGLVLVDPMEDELHVDVGSAVEAAMASWPE